MHRQIGCRNQTLAHLVMDFNGCASWTRSRRPTGYESICDSQAIAYYNALNDYFKDLYEIRHKNQLLPW